ncbi:hypothetical protein A8C75_16360 [Marinobacterium aestuarii]|uniref:DUF3467 domain-containing protein n=1 Tax=Marinobacterium aestuarii TaxID=1821621 RepID=A0A1A9F0M0_9GAMM|nr:DUF3467 domain-containing protein [Marinobacterium aestuarii]ANG63894.1 hypothetical protein A8C75_16360 [Marinobacterium aestuarii]
MDKPKQKVATPTIKWDDSRMKSTYANVCNVSSTREEITLLFGLNQAWNAQQKELSIELSDRIILNPFAAKRMATLLNNVLAQYEERFGEVGETAAVPAATEAETQPSH